MIGANPILCVGNNTSKKAAVLFQKFAPKKGREK